MSRTLISNRESTAIPLFAPYINGKEWQYVKECLDTGWVSSKGSLVERFEHIMAELIGRQFAVACVNGTSALHTALLVAGIQKDEEVLVPTLTFIATANVVRYVGAWPVFMDAEPDTRQIDPVKIKDFLSKGCILRKGKLINKTTKRTVKAIMPVHFLGHPANMDSILEDAKKYHLLVIEDAAGAIGAMYKNQPVGSLGDMACFSFNGNKIVTTGGGGMLVTENEKWAAKARYYTTQAKDDSLEQIHNEIGYNYRLSNLQAAMGVAQIEKLEEILALKEEIVNFYNNELGEIPGIRIPQEAAWAKSNHWLYTILVDKRKYGINSRQLMRRLLKEGIECRPLGHPLHTLKPYRHCQSFQIEEANRLYREGLSLPCYAGLQKEQQGRIINIIREK